VDTKSVKSRFDILKERNAELLPMIDSATANSRHDDAIEMKEELYTNKLEMLRILKKADRRSGITARSLRDKVRKMPKIPMYATGIEPLDEALGGGIEIGSLVLIGGESGTGKSYLTMEILCNVSTYAKAQFFSLEMGERRTSKRLDQHNLTDTQLDNMIVDLYSRDLQDILMEIELAASDGVRFFTIDSRMKIYVAGNDKEYQKISTITKELSSIAQRLDLIIFLINQISEEDLKSRRLSFKGSGDQKYDSDLALFYTMHDDSKDWRHLICTKNRTGDERLFALELKLVNGKTVDVSTPEISHTYVREEVA